MDKKERLIAKLKSHSKNFTFIEAEILLKMLGYSKSHKTKTNDFRIAFSKKNLPSILLHKPHPQKQLLFYQIIQLAKTLEDGGLL